MWMYGRGWAVSTGLEDPRCPECGGPVGPTATYCMHCDAEFTDSGPVSPAELADRVDGTAAGGDGADEFGKVSTASGRRRTGSLFDPTGFVDNTLTAVIGLVAGVVVGVVGFFVLLGLTGSGLSLVGGVVVWLGASAYLVRRRTVEEAIAKSGYAVAVAFLLVPVTAFSPASFEGGVVDRAGTFLVLLVLTAIPAAVAGGIGWFASRFVPEEIDDSEP